MNSNEQIMRFHLSFRTCAMICQFSLPYSAVRPAKKLKVYIFELKYSCSIRVQRYNKHLVMTLFSQYFLLFTEPLQPAHSASCLVHKSEQKKPWSLIYSMDLELDE